MLIEGDTNIWFMSVTILLAVIGGLISMIFRFFKIIDELKKFK